MTKTNTQRVITNADLDWRERAACAGKQEFFFADHKATLVREAKKICMSCPVKTQCLAHAMRHDEYGVWGGLTANERRRARRAQKKTLRVVE
jgi:WhiB family redox-sensing transcriptional regulator